MDPGIRIKWRNTIVASRNPIGKPEIDIQRCKGCELCVGACPQDILEISADFNRKGTRYAVCQDEGACTACGFCALICPDAAIQVLKFTREEVPGS